MPFNGSGTYTLPAGNPVTTGTTISSTTTNNTNSDIAAALSNCITRDGQSPATANLPLGGNKLTGLAIGTSSGDSVSYEQIQYVANISGAGTSGQVLTSNGTGAPSWQTNVAIAENLNGGAAYQIPYQSNASTTSFLANGTSGQVLTSAGSGSAPVWTSPAGLTLVSTLTPANGVSSVAVTGLSTYKNFVLCIDNIQLAVGVNGGLKFALSSNNGSSYSTAVTFTNINGTAPIGYASIYRCDVSPSNKPYFVVSPSSVIPGLVTTDTGVVNAIQITITSATTFNGTGSIYLYGVN